MISVDDVSKSFTLHNQGGASLCVMRGAEFCVVPGECVALTGPSGAGKSTLMRMVYGNYRIEAGTIRVGAVALETARPRDILALRRETLGHVSQFLRVVPRVPTLDVVAEPLRRLGVDADTAHARAGALLERLRIPQSLWQLAPATFSGGEQQRVNIARGFVHPWPALLLDEPTASLDPANRETVLELIMEAKARGAAILGIFHDADARAAGLGPGDRCGGSSSPARSKPEGLGQYGRGYGDETPPTEACSPWSARPVSAGGCDDRRSLTPAARSAARAAGSSTRPPSMRGEDHEAVGETEANSIAATHAGELELRSTGRLHPRLRQSRARPRPLKTRVAPLTSRVARGASQPAQAHDPSLGGVIQGG